MLLGLHRPEVPGGSKEHVRSTWEREQAEVWSSWVLCPVRPTGAKGPSSRKLDVIRGLRPVKEPQTTARIRNASAVPKELQEGGIQQEPQETTYGPPRGGAHLHTRVSLKDRANFRNTSWRRSFPAPSPSTLQASKGRPSRNREGTDSILPSL